MSEKSGCFIIRLIHGKIKQFFADFTRIVPDHFLVESVDNIYLGLFANKNYVA